MESLDKRILLLGSGYVAGPCLKYLLKFPEYSVTVASRNISHAEKLAGKEPRVSATTCSVENSAELDKLVAAHDLVISLIPYAYHASVIESAIRHRKHVVTTSYVSPAMAALDAKAREAGITVMNEIGVDPGVDHLYALKTIEEVHEAGGKILSFLSYCGGLPAPENSNNPLGYKFSWSSRGVLLALRNTAKYLQDSKVVTVLGKDLMSIAKPVYTGYPGFSFLGYPNRDSTPYSERYGIPEAKTILRGTLRYAGFPEFVRALVALNFLDDTPVAYLSKEDKAPLTWAQLTARLAGVSEDNIDESRLSAALLAKVDIFKGDEFQSQAFIRGCRWLGFFDKSAPVEKRGNLLDTLCQVLEQKMQYEEGERDMVFLQHTFECETRDGRRETRYSTGIWYGDGRRGGVTAMARTVGVPCGIAVNLILKKRIVRRGVIAPMWSDVNRPLLEELEREGISMVETVL